MHTWGKRCTTGRPWQFIHANKKESVLPTHPFPQTHYTPEQRQSAAASVGIMVNTAGQSLVTDDCSPKREQKISAVGLYALVCPQRMVY